MYGKEAPIQMKCATRGIIETAGEASGVGVAMLASPTVLAASTDGSGQRRLRVLARPAASGINPYTNILYENVRRAGLRVDNYGPLRALVGRYDIFHVHWPESVFNHGLWSARLTTSALLFNMKSLKRRGTKLLWTVHNLRAHDQRFPREEAEFWRAFIPELDGYFILSESGKEAALAQFSGLRSTPSFVIPHPHYRGCYPDHLSRAEAQAKLGLPAGIRVLLFVGTIADYKNVQGLIDAFRALRGDNLRLVIAGRARSDQVWQGVKQKADLDARILLFRGHVPDAQLQDYLRAANLVVLPYQEILNSGSAILALSFDRPVLMPLLGAAADLGRLLGDAWVSLYTGTLRPELLDAALMRAETLPERTDGQQLSALSPENVGRATADAYRTLLGA